MKLPKFRFRPSKTGVKKMQKPRVRVGGRPSNAKMKGLPRI